MKQLTTCSALACIGLPFFLCFWWIVAWWLPDLTAAGFLGPTWAAFTAVSSGFLWLQVAINADDTSANWAAAAHSAAAALFSAAAVPLPAAGMWEQLSPCWRDGLWLCAWVIVITVAIKGSASFKPRK